MQYLLGYMPEQSKIYLIDKELNVTPFTLHMALIEYQSAIMRKDFPTAETFFTQLPEWRPQTSMGTASISTTSCRDIRTYYGVYTVYLT